MLSKEEMTPASIEYLKSAITTFENVLVEGKEPSRKHGVDEHFIVLSQLCIADLHLLDGILVLFRQQNYFSTYTLVRLVFEHWLAWGYIKASPTPRFKQFLAKGVQNQIQLGEVLFKQEALNEAAKVHYRKSLREMRTQIVRIDKEFGKWPDSQKSMAQECKENNYLKKYELYYGILSGYAHPSANTVTQFLKNTSQNSYPIGRFTDETPFVVPFLAVSFTNSLFKELNSLYRLGLDADLNNYEDASFEMEKIRK